MINPDKLFRILNKLKKSKNPYYQFYDDYNAYKERCQSSDPEGYEAIFNDVEQEHVEQMDGTQLNEVTDEIELENNEENEEVEWVTKDPVKKYQFRYNDSLCMTSKYPEIEIQDTVSSIRTGVQDMSMEHYGLDLKRSKISCVTVLMVNLGQRPRKKKEIVTVRDGCMV